VAEARVFIRFGASNSGKVWLHIKIDGQDGWISNVVPARPESPPCQSVAPISEYVNVPLQKDEM